jgi:hypothetical protein
MGRKDTKKRRTQEDIATKNFSAAQVTLFRHPMFSPLRFRTDILRHERNLCPPDGWAVVTAQGTIHVHPTRRAEPEEWVYILAHCLLHLGFGHFQPDRKPYEWNAACDVVVHQFLAALKLGCPPDELRARIELQGRLEERLYAQFCEYGIPPELALLGTGGRGGMDMLSVPEKRLPADKPIEWEKVFAEGLALAVTSAVNVAAGVESQLGAGDLQLTPARRARDWFIARFPLLGALAATFEIVEDALICQRLQISVAAISTESAEIYINPAAGLDVPECRFVMAHELLHAGLRHEVRRQGRDPTCGTWPATT